MKKLCLSFLAMTMASTIYAATGTTAGFVTYAKIVDIEEVWRTIKVKRYTDCRDVGSTTLCDTIEWVTINDTIDFYRVTLNLGGKNGKNFVIRQKTRPTGDKRKVSVKVTTYGK
tara:strand:+ start:2133 stop:2474 length:342 start_codon:yes stop_codon:yes gene_type:complete